MCHKIIGYGNIRYTMCYLKLKLKTIAFKIPYVKITYELKVHFLKLCA